MFSPRLKCLGHGVVVASFARASSSVGRLTATSTAAWALRHAAVVARPQHGPAHFGPPAAGHQHLQERPCALHTPAHQATVLAEQDTVGTLYTRLGGLILGVFCLSMPGHGSFKWLVAKVSSSSNNDAVSPPFHWEENKPAELTACFVLPSFWVSATVFGYNSTCLFLPPLNLWDFQLPLSVICWWNLVSPLGHPPHSPVTCFPPKITVQCV